MSNQNETLREQAWNYFELHADHRLRAFNFYILLSTALVSAFVLALSRGKIDFWLSPIGFLLVFFSFVFWKLDNRTKQLLKLAEGALKFSEAELQLPEIEGKPHPLALFTREQHDTELLPSLPLLSAHFSYARCFGWIFVMFSIVGVGIIAASFAG